MVSPLTFPKLTPSSFSSDKFFLEHRCGCTHIHLVRVWKNGIRCGECSLSPPERFLFRCTEDIELQIRAAELRGPPYLGLGDKIHQLFQAQFKPVARSPEARALISSIRSENPPSKRGIFTKEQWDKLWEQRLHVLRIASKGMEDKCAMFAEFTDFSFDATMP